MLEILPASWFRADLKDLVIDFLARLPIDPIDRKRAYIEWARITGIPIEAADVERVTGLPAGQV